MTETEALLRLQQVDLELLRRNRALEALPQTAKIHNIKLAAKKLATELNKIVGARKDVEIELEDNRTEYEHMTEVLDRVQAEAGDAQDYRAVQDFEQQLTHLAKRMEKLDYAQEALKAKLEKVKASEDKARDVALRLQAEGKAQADAYMSESSAIRAEVDNLTKEREALAAMLPADLLDRYEKARKRFGGIAVESLSGNKPSVCRVSLQASSFTDLRERGEKITECPYCHRILVTSEVTE